MFKLVLIKIFDLSEISQIISGGAKGADTLAEKFAIENEIPIKKHLPDWDLYGKRAGFIRNKLIIDDANIVMAFWNGKSKGTQHSINLAEEQNKLHIVYNYETNLLTDSNFIKPMKDFISKDKI